MLSISLKIDFGLGDHFTKVMFDSFLVILKIKLFLQLQCQNKISAKMQLGTVFMA